MRGPGRNSGCYSWSDCANSVLCNSCIYYSAASTSNWWDNNIDYCSSRGSMAVCKIPFTLTGKLYYRHMPNLPSELISNNAHLDSLFIN